MRPVVSVSMSTFMQLESVLTWGLERSLPEPFSRLCPNYSNNPAAQTEFHNSSSHLLAFPGHCIKGSYIKKMLLKIPPSSYPLPLPIAATAVLCSSKKQIGKYTNEFILGGAKISKSINKQSLFKMVYTIKIEFKQNYKNYWEVAYKQEKNFKTHSFFNPSINIFFTFFC